MQWEAMVKGKATYGWEVYNDLPAEVISVEEKIISETGITKTQEPEPTPTGNIANLLNAGIRAIKDELPNLNAEDLYALLNAEKTAEEPRKSLVDLIQKQIKKLS